LKGVDGDSVARLEIATDGQCGADLLDDPDRLVASDHRVVVSGYPRSVAHGDVATAHSTGLDPHERLIRGDGWPF
jgi:hypothetical protein